jgi:hypothetical protein
MTEKPKFNAVRAILALLLLCFLSACATPGTGQQSSEASSLPPPIEPWDGDGLEIPLDGTSLQAFDQSLIRVKAYSEPEQYQSLLKAIDYLMVYDLSARGDRAKLAANLNGLTGYEVLSKVGWRKPAPGKGPAEKGAADAKIFES